MEPLLSIGNSVQASVEKKKDAAAEAAGDNKAIEEREKKLTEQLRKDAAVDRAQYSKALEKRKTELDQDAATYAAAYRRTAKQEADDRRVGLAQEDVLPPGVWHHRRDLGAAE